MGRGVLNWAAGQLSQWLGGWGESALLSLTERGLNRRGGTLTLRNARVWTGDPTFPWADGLLIRNGVIVSYDASRPEGKAIDAGGRLVVPGFQDNHLHPQVPFVLFSPQAPMLLGCKTCDEILQRVSHYVRDYSEDRFPRLFGWMTAALNGVSPTRQQLDAVVGDRPCYLVHHSGHEFWANTRALELAGILQSDPANLPRTCVVERDPQTGLATGYLQESELAGTDGLLLRAVRKAEALKPAQQALVLRYILESFSQNGVTHIWTKDGDLSICGVYEELLQRDSLPVRTILDFLYTPFHSQEALHQFRQRAALLRAGGLPQGFLRADGAKLMVDMPTDTHQAWMFDLYADGRGGVGFPVFPREELLAQCLLADRLGLTINLLTIGDRAVHEGLNALAQVRRHNPARFRRHTLEHAEFIQDADLPRFRELDVAAIFNWVGSYPDPGYQGKFAALMGQDRIAHSYQRWKELMEDGACVAMGSDFPLAPADPMAGIHVLVNGTDLEGKPPGGLWPHKNLTVEQALRSYTTHGAYARGEELRCGYLKPGYDADLILLQQNILDPSFDRGGLAMVKVNATIVNGHVVYEDFSDQAKKIDFLE